MTKENLINLSMFSLRLVTGVICVAHGAQKLFGMFGGIGLEGIVKMVEGLGFPNPYWVALIWSCVEFAGGIFLILGILARWSAGAIIFVMIVHIWKINSPYGFFIQNGGMEYSLLIIGACIPLLLIGGGSWSVWDV